MSMIKSSCAATAYQASAEPSLASDGEKIIDEKTTRRIKESKSSLQYEELMDSFEETDEQSDK